MKPQHSLFLIDILARSKTKTYLYNHSHRIFLCNQIKIHIFHTINFISYFQILKIKSRKKNPINTFVYAHILAFYLSNNTVIGLTVYHSIFLSLPPVLSHSYAVHIFTDSLGVTALHLLFNRKIYFWIIKSIFLIYVLAHTLKSLATQSMHFSLCFNLFLFVCCLSLWLMWMLKGTVWTEVISTVNYEKIWCKEEEMEQLYYFE